VGEIFPDRSAGHQGYSAVWGEDRLVGMLIQLRWVNVGMPRCMGIGAIEAGNANG
jgi:hypothetical protein